MKSTDLIENVCYVAQDNMVFQYKENGFLRLSEGVYLDRELTYYQYYHYRQATNEELQQLLISRVRKNFVPIDKFINYEIY